MVPAAVAAGVTVYLGVEERCMALGSRSGSQDEEIVMVEWFVVCASLDLVIVLIRARDVTEFRTLRTFEDLLLQIISSWGVCLYHLIQFLDVPKVQVLKLWLRTNILKTYLAI